MKQPTGPITVVDLFPELRHRLLELLSSLSREEWRLPTVCSGWSVKDVALHLLGGDVANLSRRRDGVADALLAYAPPGADLSRHGTLVSALNAWNEDWVMATRRMSPRLIGELLAVTGDALQVYYRQLDLTTLGDPVSWIGPEPVPLWVDIAREYTEQWMHQAQIRDATGAMHPPPGGIREKRLFAPVLETFMLALPYTLREVRARQGTRFRVVITGESGGEWYAVRRARQWELQSAPAAEKGEAAGTATMDEDSAWRLWTRCLPSSAAMQAITSVGDTLLAEAVRRMVTFIG